MARSTSMGSASHGSSQQRFTLEQQGHGTNDLRSGLGEQARIRLDDRLQGFAHAAPGGFSTDWGGASARHASPLEPDDHLRANRQQARANYVQGDPTATREAIKKVVDSENPPLRVFFGNGPVAIAANDYESRLATWREWESVSIAAHGTPS